MKDPVLETAIKEYNRSKADLQRSPAYQAMKAWGDVIVLRGGKLPESDEPKPRKHVPLTSTSNTVQPNKKERIRTLTADLINKSGGYADTVAIYNNLFDNKVDVARERMSAYLSENKDLFIHEKGKGWKLKEHA